MASRGTSCGTARDGPGRLAGRLVGRPAGRPIYFESKRCVSKYKKQYFGNVIYVFCPGRLAEVVCDKLSLVRDVARDVVQEVFVGHRVGRPAGRRVWRLVVRPISKKSLAARRYDTDVILK